MLLDLTEKERKAFFGVFSVIENLTPERQQVDENPSEANLKRMREIYRERERG